MNSKEKKKILFITIILLFLLLFYIKSMSNKYTYAINNVQQKNSLAKISTAKNIDIERIIELNTKTKINTAQVIEKQEELEYITKYRENPELYVGTTAVSQEGRNGIQTIATKKTFDIDGNLIGEEQVSCKVTKSSIDKIIDIGTKIYVEPKKITSVENKTSGTLKMDIMLNKPSGFTIEQFKKALTDSKDKNKIFENNAEYFYYIEDEYQINGIFIAALGIHESAWGTSSLAKNKYNLFGYGAYDSNPYNGAYTFESYSESIDLLARVMVKYYINPSGTKIYDGQVASGKYYSGSTLNAVNKKYATDNSWANGVFKHMQYLYSKIETKK